ncbi:MAG: prolipoprotein diacylglyceryl transferase [Planctomycetota bacterium]
MRSELFRIPVEVGGVPIFGVGVLLLAWLIAGAAWAWWLSRRPDGRREIMSLLPTIAIGGAVLIALPRFLPDGLPVRGYGVMLVLAALTGVAMAIHRARERGVDADTILSMVFGMFVLGIVGARLFFVIEYWDEAFSGDTLFARIRNALLFTEGGLVVYGSLIGGAVAFVWFCRSRRLRVLAMADIIAPSLAVGLAIGRIGCLLNGCCYGHLCERPWAVTFPRQSSAERLSPAYADQLTSGEFHGFRWEEDSDTSKATVTRVEEVASDAGLETGNELVSIGGVSPQSDFERRQLILSIYDAGEPLVLGLASGETVTLPAAPQRMRSLPVHPTQIYSAVNAGLLGWFLWLYYPLRRRDGEVAALLLTIYPVGRFLLEMIRTDESSFLGTGLSISQNVSLVLLAAVAAFWVFLLRSPVGRAEQLQAV